LTRQATRATLVALVLLALGSAPAWAIPPSGGTIVLKTGKLGVTSTGLVSAPGAVKWKAGASDTAGVGCCTYRVSGGPRPSNTMTANKFNVNLRNNTTYAYVIDGYDAAGAYLGRTFAPGESYVTFFSAEDDGDAGYTSGWLTGRTSGAYGGSLHYTFQDGATATFGPVYGSSFGIVMEKGGYGVANIWLDGRLVATVDCFSPTLQQRQIVHVSSPDRAGFDETHFISIERSPASADGRAIALDGLAVLFSD
jgi:hypothetical protein